MLLRIQIGEARASGRGLSTLDPQENCVSENCNHTGINTRCRSFSCLGRLGTLQFAFQWETTSRSRKRTVPVSANWNFKTKRSRCNKDAQPVKTTRFVLDTRTSRYQNEHAPCQNYANWTSSSNCWSWEKKRKTFKLTDRAK